VHSYLPYEGRVEIHNKTARRIAIRIPPWVWPSQLACCVNENARPVVILAGRLVFDDLRPGDRVSLRFPLADTTITRTVDAKTKRETVCTITTRGNTVMDISPRVESPALYPLYDRAALRKDQTPMKTAPCRVLDKVAPW
jgi:hypothetical protein